MSPKVHLEKNKTKVGGTLELFLPEGDAVQVAEEGVETLVLRTNSLPDVSVPLGCTLLIRRSFVNGRIKVIVVAGTTLLWAALLEGNKPVIMARTNQ